MKSYNHFSQNERLFIDQGYNVDHKSIREIAKLLNKNPSSVSREINRNLVNGDYVYLIADAKSIKRSWHKHMFYLDKGKEFTEIFVKYYDKRYCGVYLTMQIIKENYPDLVCPSTREVFRGLKSDRGKVRRKDRLRLYYQRPRKRTQGVFSEIKRHGVRPFGSRPKKISLRVELGHGEGDLIVGKRANGHKNILTLNDIASRKLYATFVDDKNPYTMNKMIRKMIIENDLPFNSLTLDNGLEFQAIGSLGKEMEFPIYICEPFASYQRGSNENINGLIRRFGKKGTDFNQFSDDDLQDVVNKINSMRRKMFNWKSSNEIGDEMKKGLPGGKPS